ncbi:EAL domain-containing protein [Photobacterium sagamiensis]|uniref:EAL domain-containing protein n=1 Tax=Photobacterium sagamiensis TaxID=2910241 RepID=UPI003D0ACE3B
MSIFKQFYSLLLGLFLLVVTSIGYIQFTEIRELLAHQMDSELNNTSQTLAVTLEPALEAGDSDRVETLLQALFTKGSYQEITLTWVVDGHQQSWKRTDEKAEAPAWFIGLNLFSAPEETTMIRSGWMDLAELKMVTQADVANTQLWEIVRNSLIIFCGLFILIALLARFTLSRLLRPLNAIASHTHQIAQHQFDAPLPVPKIQELRPVVIGINNMSKQLQQNFLILNEEVITLRENNLIDKVSALPNRQYFIDRINSWVDEPGTGAILLAKFDWLHQLHNQLGFQIRDDTIHLLSQTLKQKLNHESYTVVARIADYEFAFLLTEQDHQQLQKQLHVLIQTINQEISKAGYQPNHGFAIGISERSNQNSASELLAQADNALQQAVQGNTVYHWFENQQQLLFSKEQWRDMLSSALSHQQFSFRWQPVHYHHDGTIIHQEIFCQLKHDQQRIPARHFMPYIEMLALGAALDRCLIKSLHQNGILKQSQTPVAINLTTHSITDPDFRDWLASYLADSPYTNKLLFELPESAIYANQQACEHLSEIFKATGAEWGIDHFGRQLSSMDYLQSLRPSYVKLDQSFARTKDNHHKNELCRALINIARGMEINIILTGIQTREQVDYAATLNTCAYQGFIAPPVDITEVEQEYS